MSKYRRNLNIGLAGEYMVASVMSLKGWGASLTLKNYSGGDINGIVCGYNKALKWYGIFY